MARNSRRTGLDVVGFSYVDEDIILHMVAWKTGLHRTLLDTRQLCTMQNVRTMMRFGVGMG